MTQEKEISMKFTTTQVQSLLQLLRQCVEVKGTDSMRVVVGIEDTINQAVKIATLDSD